VEFDPLISPPDTSLAKKFAFMWGVENYLRLNNTPHYYFNVHTTDETWVKNLQHWGAQPVSKEPEIRFKKVL
jgi:hypothetical protein